MDPIVVVWLCRHLHLMLLLLHLLSLLNICILVGYEIQHMIFVVFMNTFDNVVVQDRLEKILNIVWEEVLDETVYVDVLVFVLGTRVDRLSQTRFVHLSSPFPSLVLDNVFRIVVCFMFHLIQLERFVGLIRLIIVIVMVDIVPHRQPIFDDLLVRELLALENNNTIS